MTIDSLLFEQVCGQNKAVSATNASQPSTSGPPQLLGRAPGFAGATCPFIAADRDEALAQDGVRGDHKLE
jgi:hypothetical protein